MTEEGKGVALTILAIVFLVGGIAVFLLFKDAGPTGYIVRAPTMKSLQTAQSRTLTSTPVAARDSTSISRAAICTARVGYKGEKDPCYYAEGAAVARCAKKGYPHCTPVKTESKNDVCFVTVQCSK